MQFNALETIQAFEAGRGARKERERETAMKGVGNALAGGNYGQAASLGFQIDPMLGMQLTDYGDSRNALALRKDIGGMVAAGDRKGAAAKAYGAGEFEMGANIDAQIAQMTQKQREDALFLSSELGNAALTLQGITDPQQRMAQWQQMQGRFVNDFGMSPESFADFDPMDDTALQRAVGEAQSFSDRLAGKRADEQFAYTQKIDERNYNRGVYEFDTTRQDALDAARAGAEAEAAAGSKINVDDEASFRREYNSITSDFRDVQAAYGRIKATDATTPAGQLSLVYQYMKMLDPGSTVMQGEQASAANARGVPEATRNLYNQIILGKPLSTGQVADFVNQADRIYGRSLEDYDKARTTYEGLADQYGFDRARVVPDFATGRPEGTVFKGGSTTQIPQGAVQELMSDPSPEKMRFFDEYYGEGQAQKVLQQRGQFPSRVTF